jgi:hypothetical protein
VGAIRVSLSALLLSLALAAAAAGNTPNRSQVPFFGQGPDDAHLKKELMDDIRRFAEAERVAVLEITLLCEVDRAALSHKGHYDPWERRCTKTEALWADKYRTRHENRMIDIQMRLYLERRQALHETAERYFAQKADITRKRKRREDIRADVKEAVRLRKQLAAISTEMLKFFFALRDLFAEVHK